MSWTSASECSSSQLAPTCTTAKYAGDGPRTSPSRSDYESLTSCVLQYSIHQLRTRSIKILMSDQYCSSCQRTHHCKDKCEQIDRYWVEVVAVLDAIRSTVFESASWRMSITTWCSPKPITSSRFWDWVSTVLNEVNYIPCDERHHRIKVNPGGSDYTAWFPQSSHPWTWIS